ncbi:hypothetical protein [Streptomyces sp. NPDC054794]
MSGPASNKGGVPAIAAKADGDGDGGDDEGEEALALAPKAAVQSAAAVQSGHHALDHPAVSAQAARVLHAAPSDARNDPSSA